ncbi:hypothetical protein ACHAWF_018305 [Thalassiosira exigua]
MFGPFYRRALAVTGKGTVTPISSRGCQGPLFSPLFTPRVTARHATKKAGGSSNNGRDSAGRRLGIKVWPGAKAKAGGIVVRQRGKKFLAGENAGMGNDHTVFALVAGVVKMTRSPKNNKRKIVHVITEGS